MALEAHLRALLAHDYEVLRDPRFLGIALLVVAGVAELKSLRGPCALRVAVRAHRRLGSALLAVCLHEVLRVRHQDAVAVGAELLGVACRAVVGARFV